MTGAVPMAATAIMMITIMATTLVVIIKIHETDGYWRQESLCSCRFLSCIGQVFTLRYFPGLCRSWWSKEAFFSAL
jgi:hypothetical protein